MEVNKMMVFFFVLAIAAILGAVGTLITAVVFESLVLAICFCVCVLLMICGMFGMIICDYKWL
jgi:hypothetical protein